MKKKLATDLTFSDLPAGAIFVFIATGQKLVKVNNESAKTEEGRAFYITKKAPVHIEEEI